MYFSLAKEFGNWRNEKKNLKNHKENSEKVERFDNRRKVNEDNEKTAKSVKSPDGGVKAVNNMEKIIKSNKCNILPLAYQQGQIFAKFRSHWKFYWYG